MSITGFSIKNNLSEIQKGSTAMRNLLSDGAKPFTFDGLDIFKGNNLNTSQLDWIPNNHIFAVPVDESFSITDSVIKLKNVSDSSPGNTLNLSVQAGDIVAKRVIPDQIVVSGFTGSSSYANGTYTKQSGTINGKSVWEKGTPATPERIFYTGTQWNIDDLGEPGTFAFHLDDTDLPPKSGWTLAGAFGGVVPAGTPALSYTGDVADAAIQPEADIKISSISRQRSIDRGTLVLDSAIGSSSIGNDTPIKIKKQNSATYSPSTGTWTFGNDLNFFFSDGDIIDSVKIKGVDSPLDCPTTIYPAVVFDKTVKDNGQVSFRLKRSTAINDTPIQFNTQKFNSPSNLKFSNSPLRIIQFNRNISVSKDNLRNIVPTDFNRLANGANDLVDIDISASGGNTAVDATGVFTGYEDIQTTLNIGETNDTTFSNIKSVGEVISNIKAFSDLTKDIIKTKIDTSKNYLNDSGEEFVVEGVIKIQDPDVLNSPGTKDGSKVGFGGFTNSPYGLTPASYIFENNSYSRAFSTFDGPWDFSPGTGSDGEKIFTNGDSPDHPEFVQDIIVNQLVFKHNIIFEEFDSPNLIEVVSIDNVNSPAGAGSNGFDFKMPIKVEEIDPDTQELVEVDYFLLLKAED